MQSHKAKGKQNPSSLNISRPNTRSQAPEITYQRTRDALISGLKLVKAASESTSFLGPLKATCEISLLFLETTRNINENTKGLKQLNGNLSAHIVTLDEAYASVAEARIDQMPDALKDFEHALGDYIALKDILTRMDEQMHQREKGAKGLFRKLSDSRIEVEAIADYKQEIEQCTRVFEDTTSVRQIELQTEVWDMARLGPERPRPMGTQHKTCLPGTREPIMNEIRQWGKNPNVEKRAFWLRDVAGSGKSTVALTMCEEWDDTPNFLVGRFFFSKNARNTSETDAFCSVVAEDIGSKSEEIMQKVQSAKQKDPHLIDRRLRHQFAKLIEEPLKLANDDVVIVIDALDECKKEMRGALLRFLLEKLSSMPKVRLFITSRPEPDIAAILQDRAIARGMNFDMHGKNERTNLEDITTYVDAHLTKLLTTTQRQQLIERSNGLFIWITTASLELQQVQGPEAINATLQSLLTKGKGGDANQVYAGVLRRLIREQHPDVIYKVLGTILILFEPVSTEALAKLTNIAQPELEHILASMQSVFCVDNAVEFIHLTFREYLVGAHNSEMPFDFTTVQSALAISVLNILQEDLKEDICGIYQPDQPYPKLVDVLDLNERLQRVWNSSPALPYLAKYWSSHIVPVAANENVAKVLRGFLETRILHFIELVCLMGQMHLFRNLEEARRGFGYQRSNSVEAELCRDAVRLVQRHQAILEESPLHIYSSALLFLPRKTRLWTTYGSKATRGLPNIVGPPSEHWPSHQVLVGHGSPVTCVAISPDGIRMASGSDDKTLRLWDVMTGASMGELRGHTKAVTCLAFSSDGLQIASGSWDGAVRLWDTKAGAPAGTNTPEVKGHTVMVTCLAFSPDGLYVASGSRDATLRLWDAKTGASITELSGHTSAVTCLTFFPDGLCIASGSEDYTLRLWDVKTGASIGELKGHTGVVTCLAILPDGLLIASGSEDSTLRLWDVTTGASIQELKGHTDIITCLALLPDEPRITSGSRDKTLRLWDTTTGASIAELKGHTGVVTCLALSPDGLSIASGSRDTRDTTLRLWNATTGASIGELEGHTSGVTCLAYSSDGLHTASGSHDKSIRLWDATICPRIAVLKGDTSRVACLAFSPDGLLIASQSLNGTLRLWEVATASSLGAPYTLSTRVYGGHSLRFAEDGRSIQVNNRMIFDVSQRQFILASPTRTIVYSSPQHSNIQEHNRELWSISCPHRRYRVPPEIKWSAFTKHRDQVAFGLNDGQIMVIDFTDLQASS